METLAHRVKKLELLKLSLTITLHFNQILAKANRVFGIQLPHSMTMFPQGPAGT